MAKHIHIHLHSGKAKDANNEEAMKAYAEMKRIGPNGNSRTDQNQWRINICKYMEKSYKISASQIKSVISGVIQKKTRGNSGGLQIGDQGYLLDICREFNSQGFFDAKH